MCIIEIINIFDVIEIIKYIENFDNIDVIEMTIDKAEHSGLRKIMIYRNPIGLSLT
jgi:hypothetical protein